MFGDLIDCEELLEAYAEMFGFEGVTFKRDFGPWKKGDKIERLWFELDGKDGIGIAKQTDTEGVTVAETKFQLVAIS